MKAVKTVEDFQQSLYREAQLALRAAIGTKELDVLLSNKDEITAELHQIVEQKAAAFGLMVLGLGIKDIILPGEMRELLNQVIPNLEFSGVLRKAEDCLIQSFSIFDSLPFRPNRPSTVHPLKKIA